MEEIDTKERIFIQTCNVFEIFLDKKPMVFGRSKSKELIAFILDRGGKASKEMIARVLFNDKKYLRKTQIYISALARDIDDKFHSLGLCSILQRELNFFSLDMNSFSSDISNKIIQATFYEYMSQYSWAESSPFKIRVISDEEDTFVDSLKIDNTGIFMKTKDEFEMFLNGSPVHFSRSKSKKLLEVLVRYNGVGINRRDIASYLFPESLYTRSIEKYLTVIIKCLVSELDKYGCKDLLIIQRNCYSVNISSYKTDYDFVKNFSGGGV